MTDSTDQKTNAANGTAQVVNGFEDFAMGATGQNYYGGSQVSQTDTFFKNNRWYLVSNFRQLLSEMYAEHGIVQTLVDQPVDDAFQNGFDIKSAQLDSNDIEQIQNFLQRNLVIEEIKYACKWARLYGGGALIPITNQDPKTPLQISKINKDTPLTFKAVDLWELYYSYVGDDGDLTFEGVVDEYMLGDTYDYYGRPVHKSRVWRVEGKRPPSFIRPRLRGWGMSELEKIVRSFNQYLKNQNVTFELLDEAKVDIYQIKGLNAAMTNATAQNVITKRVMLGNHLKNYLNALVMDSDDTFDHKQVNFAGLAEMLVQIRIGIAADLKMPMTKLFGLSAAGFNSGEDDIENYNSMIKSEIQSKCKFLVMDTVGIICQKLFGFVPDDLQITFPPLRILNAKEEEEVKNAQFNRTMAAYQSGLVGVEETKKAINADSLLPVEIVEDDTANPPLDAQNIVGGTGNTVDK